MRQRADLGPTVSPTQCLSLFLLSLVGSSPKQERFILLTLHEKHSSRIAKFYFQQYGGQWDICWFSKNTDNQTLKHQNQIRSKTTWIIIPPPILGNLFSTVKEKEEFQEELMFFRSINSVGRTVFLFFSFFLYIYFFTPNLFEGHLDWLFNMILFRNQCTNVIYV